MKGGRERLALSRHALDAVFEPVAIVLFAGIKRHDEGDHLALRQGLVRWFIGRDGDQGELSRLHGFGLREPGEVDLTDEIGEGLCFEERTGESFSGACDEDLVEGPRREAV